jgi:tetratricopeptide (TPR) repeat protein
MGLRRCACLLLLLWSALGWAGGKSSPPANPHTNALGRLPVTTSSALARVRFEKAMQYSEELRIPDALQALRAAVKADPKFAQAYILISNFSHDPAEQQAARTRAKQLAPRVSRAEQLLIRWLAGAQEDNYVPAIAAMNDLLEKFPRDQRLAFLAGGWLVKQEQYKQGVVVLERAVALAPNYPAALNELGYAYAFSGDFEKGFAAMERYVALQPDEPNPHDSYGEILRLAGKFDAALEQYQMSIRIDPNFGSELGVADTYALMGKEQEARDEYERAIVFAPGPSEKVEYELQAAMTWIRENNRKQAERALRDVVKHAHAAGLARLEAEAHRVQAVYEPDYKAAVKHLQAAQSALEDGRHELSRSDRNEGQARILRVQVMRAAEAQAGDDASSALKQLETMAETSRSRVVQLSYHAALGALLLAQQKYPEAISHLEEDSDDPLSLRLLWRGYSSQGEATRAGTVATRLAGLNVPTVEQALVVPQFRAGLVGQDGRP